MVFLVLPVVSGTPRRMPLLPLIRFSETKCYVFLLNKVIPHMNLLHTLRTRAVLG